MSEVMTKLQSEHRNISKILDALEHQMTVFDRGEQPDYDILTAIAAYFVGFPDRCHHPKEDLIYARLLAKGGDETQKWTDLEAEHEKISKLAHYFSQAVENVLKEVEVSRSTFIEVARHFVAQQRRHMKMEEEHFFPRALDILTPEDWAEIDEKMSDEKDPLFLDVVSEEFLALRENILQWDADGRLA